MTYLDPYIDGSENNNPTNLLIPVLAVAHNHNSDDPEQYEAEMIVNSEWMNATTEKIQEEVFNDTKKRIIRMIEEHTVDMLDEDQLLLVEDIIYKIKEHKLGS